MAATARGKVSPHREAAPSLDHLRMMGRELLENSQLRAEGLEKWGKRRWGEADAPPCQSPVKSSSLVKL